MVIGSTSLFTLCFEGEVYGVIDRRIANYSHIHRLAGIENPRPAASQAQRETKWKSPLPTVYESQPTTFDVLRATIHLFTQTSIQSKTVTMGQE